MKITVEKGGVALVCSLARQSTMRRLQSVHQSSGERGSSNEDQVKKQAALDGPTWNHSIGCVKSSTKQLMSLTAKVEKLFSKLQSENEKLK